MIWVTLLTLPQKKKKKKKKNPPKNTNFLLYRIHYYQGRAKTKIMMKERL
jgi:hypothetical protein